MASNSPEEISRQAGHETTDVSVWGIWLTGIGLAVSCGVTMLVALYTFHAAQVHHQLLDQAEATQDVARSVSEARGEFPEPRVQVAPQEDLADLRAREEAELTRYGWIDRKAGVVRLPIDRAMDLLLERGLPVRGQPGAPAPTRTVLDMQQARPSDWAAQKQQQPGLQQEYRQEQQQQPQQLPAVQPRQISK